jgi:flagellar basal-body rod modification protein FlgD
VGKKVQVRTDAGLYMEGNKLAGAIEVPTAVSDLALNVYNDVGQLVKTYHINGAQKGDVAFAWDGLDENGNAMPSGVYRFEAKGSIDGKTTQFDTFVASNVDSVTINKNGQPMMLNVSGFGKVSINDIKTIS